MDEPRTGHARINRDWSLARGRSRTYAWGVRRGKPERGWALALGVVLGVAVVTSVVIFFFVRSYETVLLEAFRERSLAYVSAFADAAGPWLAGGENEEAKDTARVLLLGSAFYVQVVARGQVLLDERVDGADRLELPLLGEQPSVRTARLARLGQAGTYLDVIIPRPSTSPGTQGALQYVRIGIDASAIGVRGRGMALMASGTGVLIDLALAGAVFLLVRRSRFVPGRDAARTDGEPEPAGKGGRVGRAAGGGGDQEGEPIRSGGVPDSQAVRAPLAPGE